MLPHLQLSPRYSFDTRGDIRFQEQSFDCLIDSLNETELSQAVCSITPLEHKI